MSSKRDIPPGRIRRWCLLVRPHGTVIKVTMDWSYPMQWDKHLLRVIHIELHGGAASSETGYMSHFTRHRDSEHITEEWVNRFALEYAEECFQRLHPKGQFDLFEQPTH